jgi:hypothetical protein
MKKVQSAAEARSRRGPPRQWDENTQARFKEGTMARIEAALREGETRVAFVNDAVLRELTRREKGKAK